MELSEIGVVAGLVLLGFATFYAAFAVSRRRRAGRRAPDAAADAKAAPAARSAEPDPQLQAEAAAAAARRIERRLEEIEAVQAELAERLEEAASASSSARIEALAGSLLGLIRDKNATLETALAGLDQLRGRIHALEQMGEPAEARGLLERLTTRLDALKVDQAADRAALEARLEALRTDAPQPLSELADQFTRLYAQKDAAVETVFARLAPLEARMGEMQAAFAARDPQAALDGFAARLEEVQTRVAERLEEVQTRGGERLAEVQARLEALAEPGENPFAEISDQLTRLYSQKDATVEMVFARLAPLEARLVQVEGIAPRLAALEAGTEARDPGAALDGFAARLEEMQVRMAAQLEEVQARTGERFADMQARLEALAEPGENPFAEISDQFARLYAQKDATVETVFARLAPLEARMGEMQAALAAQDLPQAALAALAEDIEALRRGQEAARDQIVGLQARAETDPYADLVEQLTRLHAQKDATVETVFARLTPLEARLGEMEAALTTRDPRAALDGFAARLEDVQARVAEAQARSGERLEEMQARTGERFAEVQARIEALAEPGENPFAEISDQLTRLYAQKDATVETVFARLAPLEARLAEAEGIAPRLAALEAGMEARDPGAALAALDARLDALQGAQGEAVGRLAALRTAVEDERPAAELAERFARLEARKEAALAGVAARIEALEARLGELAAREITEDEARAEAQAIATQMIAARAVAEQTELFANRLSLLEGSLPRLSLAQTLMMQALERQAAPWPGTSAPAHPAPGRGPAAAPEERPAEFHPGEGTAGGTDGTPEDIEAIWRMPRVVSLHQLE